MRDGWGRPLDLGPTSGRTAQAPGMAKRPRASRRPPPRQALSLGQIRAHCQVQAAAGHRDHRAGLSGLVATAGHCGDGGTCLPSNSCSVFSVPSVVKKTASRCAATSGFTTEDTERTEKKLEFRSLARAAPATFQSIPSRCSRWPATAWTRQMRQMRQMRPAVTEKQPVGKGVPNSGRGPCAAGTPATRVQEAVQEVRAGRATRRRQAGMSRAPRSSWRPRGR